MPKRKCDDTDEFDYISRKLKKLEKKLKECRRPAPKRRIIESSSSSSESSREPSPSSRKKQDEEPLTFNDARDDSLADIVDGRARREPERAATPPAPAAAPPAPVAVPPAGEVPAASSTSSAGVAQPDDVILDNIVLDILGDDPTASVTYGAEIHKDLASRFEHLATNGLDKKIRKELTEKYLIPSNCVHIGAPSLNAEVKAALPETMVKRDKAIEARQKQLSSAIACLAGAMTDQLNSKEKNHDLLKKLMDAGRLLCDLQYTESTTRRKFAVFALNKDMKEHLTNTKIDKCLFGENLSEALKTAKAVNKSGTDLKVKESNNYKKSTPRQKSSAPEGKNWKPPVPARRTAGAAGTTKSRPPPASSRAPHGSSFKRSSPPPKPAHRQ